MARSRLLLVGAAACWGACCIIYTFLLATNSDWLVYSMLGYVHVVCIPSMLAFCLCADSLDSDAGGGSSSGELHIFGWVKYGYGFVVGASRAALFFFVLCPFFFIRRFDAEANQNTSDHNIGLLAIWIQIQGYIIIFLLGWPWPSNNKKRTSTAYWLLVWVLTGLICTAYHQSDPAPKPWINPFVCRLLITLFSVTLVFLCTTYLSLLPTPRQTPNV